MLRWTTAITTIAFTAILLALFEPVIGAPDAEKLFWIVLSIPLFRSPLWLSSFHGVGRPAGGTRLAAPLEFASRPLGAERHEAAFTDLGTDSIVLFGFTGSSEEQIRRKHFPGNGVMGSIV